MILIPVIQQFRLFSHLICPISNGIGHAKLRAFASISKLNSDYEISFFSYRDLSLWCGREYFVFQIQVPDSPVENYLGWNVAPMAFCHDVALDS